MLELDLMLQGFLDHEYENAAQPTQDAFVELLNYSDQDLLELLMARSEAEEPSINDVIQKVRHATRVNA